MINAKLILADLWRPGEDRKLKVEREWPCKVESGNVTISYHDFVEALEIMKGCYTKRLRLQTESGNDLRTMEQLENADPVIQSN